jgi:hypothetical protein
MNDRSIQAHTDAELNHAQLKKLEKRLVPKRRELANMFDTMNQQIVMKDDCSISDAAEAASVQESRAHAGSELTVQSRERCCAEISIRIELHIY